MSHSLLDCDHEVSSYIPRLCQNRKRKSGQRILDDHIVRQVKEALEGMQINLIAPLRIKGGKSRSGLGTMALLPKARISITALGSEFEVRAAVVVEVGTIAKSVIAGAPELIESIRAVIVELQRMTVAS